MSSFTSRGKFASLARTHSQPLIEMTPLIDIVFQLLLFFILTAAVSQPALNIDLPDASLKSPTPQAALVISLDKNGGYYINNKPASLKAVEGAVENIAQTQPAAHVTLQASKQAPYGAVFDLLQMARSRGLSAVDLAYDEK